MTTLTGTAAAPERSVTSIPPLTHAEAGTLSQTEYERTLAVWNSWRGTTGYSQPTAPPGPCATWLRIWRGRSPAAPR